MNALPAPEIVRAPGAIPPRTLLEKRVAQVWRQVLGIADVDIRQNFFDLGGNSFLLYRVFSQLREIRRDLQLVDLFRYTSVEDLAGFLAGVTPAALDAAPGRARGEERRVARRRTRSSRH